MPTLPSRWILLLSIGLPATLAAAWFGPPKETQVAVNVDLTPEGRKVSPPSPGHPVYYFPLLGGYRELGAIVAGEKKPAPDAVAHLVAKALASSGYFVASQKHPSPSLLLVINWGYLNPETDESGAPGESTKTIFNEGQMLALVGGANFGGYYYDFGREDIIQAAHENRYFVVVSAYDFEAARKHKKVPLWHARMSVASDGVELAQVLPAMVNTGARHFGRETSRPELIFAPIDRTGTVEIGTPRVVPDTPPAAAPSPAPAPAKE